MTSEWNLMTLVGNPKAGSRTLTVANEVSAQLASMLETWDGQVHTTCLDLAELSPHMFDMASETFDTAMQSALAADLLLVVSPTYKATYTGLLKAFLDRFPQNALGGKIAVPVMVGAAPIHSLAVDTYLRPLLIELGASCPTRGLFVLESQLESLSAVVEKWLQTARFALGGMRSSRDGVPALATAS